MPPSGRVTIRTWADISRSRLTCMKFNQIVGNVVVIQLLPPIGILVTLLPPIVFFVTLRAADARMPISPAPPLVLVARYDHRQYQ